VNKKSSFEQWVEDMENDVDPDEDFERYRCMSPENYMFPEVKVLKESSNTLTQEELMVADDPIPLPKLIKVQTKIPKRRRYINE
jgi:hypothetical protein